MCGPCIGMWDRKGVAKGESNSLIASNNRNFALTHSCQVLNDCFATHHVQFVNLYHGHSAARHVKVPHARFEPGTSKSLKGKQNKKRCPCEIRIELDFTPRVRREWKKNNVLLPRVHVRLHVLMTPYTVWFAGQTLAPSTSFSNRYILAQPCYD